MPPRLPSAGAPLATLDTALQHSTLSKCSRRAFSSTPSANAKSRWQMWQWIKKRGTKLYGPDATNKPGPSYLGGHPDQPFPLNPLFRSQPVLSDWVRDTIYRKVIVEGEAIKAVSKEFGVDVRRVGAVVRLKEVEKRMITEDKPLARAYARSINGMLPQTRLADPNTGDAQIPHESINEITVHRQTQKQLFVPVSESRHFTREDAAKAFHEKLLPADQRSFQKELITAERDMAAGMPKGEAMTKWMAEVQRTEDEYAAKVAAELDAERKRVTNFETGRAAYRIKDIKVEDGGKTGKSPRGVGWRYGAPHQDRRRGQVKIPTQVP